MYDTALKLQQTYFADRAEADEAIARVEDVIAQFESHAHHEDNYILPAIEAYEPQVVEALEQEHVADIELGNRLQALLNMFRSTETDMERINCGSAINKCFRDFMVFNIEHMAKEESEVNYALWEHYTDQEIIELNRKLISTIPPEEMKVTSTWMLRSINKEEATTWLKSVKHSAPAFVFQSLYELAENELPESIREEVLEAVLERDLIAF
jgi:hypothetical protein